jgi:propionate CoA-transferase
VIVNYDHFTINPEVLDEYSAMIDDATSSFLRAKLGQRSLAPYIFESAEEARAHLRQLESQVTGWSARKRCPDE